MIANQPLSAVRLWTGFGVLLVMLLANVAVSYLSLQKLVAATHSTSESQQTIKELGELRGAMIDAETEQRDYLITGAEHYLAPYTGGRPMVNSKLDQLLRRVAPEPEQTARLAILQKLVNDKFLELNHTIDVRKQAGARAAAGVIQSDNGKPLMDRIRHLISDAQDDEEAALAMHVAEAESSAYLATVTFILANVLNLMLLAGALIMILRDTSARRLSAQQQSKISEQLAHSLGEVQQRNQEITYLSQMSSFLLTCENSDEACTAIARFGPQLFPTEAGAIYIFHDSRNYLERAAAWGDTAVAENDLFAPNDCWALRRGRLHVVDTHDVTMVCAHVAKHGGVPSGYICAPMMAQGETLGLLYLHPAREGGAWGEAKQRLAAAVAEQIALALANLRLRETLRQQSVRDPLTGLYNRRFFEESLDRELAQLERKKKPLALIMFDIDHFKNFNDTFGHEAGDAVLRDLGRLLPLYVRDGDIACRFGGEEFTVILPEADIETGRQRAEVLREAMRELRLTHDGKSLGAVTISLGVACFPEHGRRREHLLQVADSALYDAKNRGRNCVVVSGVQTLKVIEIPPQRDQAGR